MNTPSDSSDAILLNILYSALKKEFNSRVWLIFTGVQRLAKNTLINALQECAIVPFSPLRADCEIPSSLFDESSTTIVQKLAINARIIADNFLSFQHSFLDRSKIYFKENDQMTALSPETIATEISKEIISNFASNLTKYWVLKRKMAHCSESHDLSFIRNSLYDISAGYSLCGAGGGGFAVVVLKSNNTLVDLQMKVELINSAFEKINLPKEQTVEADKFDSLIRCTIHTAEIDFEGISQNTWLADPARDLSHYLLL